MIFPAGIPYNRKEDRCRTDKVNEAFEYIAELKRLLQESKGRTALKKSESAALVVPKVEGSNLILDSLKELSDI